METRKLLTVMAIVLLSALGIKAQTNTLSTPEVTMGSGKEIPLPVNMDNTSDIVAVQFTLSVPDGLTVREDGIGTTGRTSSHDISFSKKSEGSYKVIILSSGNSIIKGSSGSIMTMPIYSDENLKEGTAMQPVFSEVAIVTRDGSNVATGYSNGTVTISPTPDLIVKDINTNVKEITPGENIIVNWTVENIGGADTEGGWSEQIALLKEDGSYIRPISTTYHEGILDAGGIVSRQAEIALPLLLGIDGNVRVQVRVVPTEKTGEALSAQDNNTTTGTSSILVHKVLQVSLSKNRIEENDGRSISLNIGRSGSWQDSETFEISTTEDDRVNLPSSITIPANQSGSLVKFNVSDNDILDNDSIVTITVKGGDYPVTTGMLTIEDDEMPLLTITVSNDDINEGETFRMTVTSSLKQSTPTIINLTCEKAGRFTFPRQVTIPADEDHVSFDVVAVDNDEIEADETIAFMASADRFERGECLVTLYDDDMPTLEFTLSPDNVSESAGYAALMGTIKRSDKLDKRVTLKLSDNSDGLLSYSSKTIVLEKNQKQAQFSIGVLDNDIVDGDHKVTVTASVYSSSCGCSVGEETNGSLTADLTVIDDDGPTLKIKPEKSVMHEGSDGNIFMISLNAKSDKDLRVKVSSDKDEILDYNHDVLIPAGEMTGTLSVDVKDNDITDDNALVTFKVEADGYALGTCWIMITDQTLPDAVISLSADRTEVEAEQTIGLRATVKNVGNSVLRSNTPVTIAFSGSKNKVRLATEQPIEAGDSTSMEFDYTLPQITGNHFFEASVNPDNNVPELLYVNNTSNKVGVTIASPFTATAKVNKMTYRQGEEVIITGTAGRNANVEVYIINGETRQKLSTTSNGEGKYSTGWQPFSTQSGHFSVGACYPGEKAEEKMDEFDIYGLNATDRFKTHNLKQYETVTGKIKILNPGNLNQTGLTVKPQDIPDNCEFTYDAPDFIDADGSVEIVYSIKGNDLSKGKDWQLIPLVISTAEGSNIEYTLHYFVHPHKAKLETDTKTINTTITLGTTREYPISIRNVGKAETGKITLSLPEWIQTATPRVMSSLAQGDSTTVMLRFVSTDAMKPNLVKSASIGINCENGDGIGIDINLTPVSEEKGTIEFDVVDEYTFYTKEGPHVNDATIRIMNPSTGKIVAEGMTMADGTYNVTLPEGYYTVEVRADKHKSYENTIIIDPGVEKEKEIFLPYQAITYSWKTERTEIEDVYEVESVANYETRVPKPVVVITLPEEKPEMYSIIPVIATNKGLVNALDARLSMSVSKGYALEYLNEPSLEVLAPQQDYVFYVKLVPSDSGESDPSLKKINVSEPECFSIGSLLSHRHDCEKYQNRETVGAERLFGNCTGPYPDPRPNEDDPSIPGLGWPFGDGWPSGWGWPGTPTDDGDKKVETVEIPITISQPVKDCRNPNSIPEDVPITRPIVSDDKPEEQPCDSKEEPVLVYKLIPVEGERYEMKGVAADGVSKVKIVLDPKQSRVPAEDCGSITDIKWELSKELGKIEGNSLREAIYTAPDSFPDSYGRIRRVQAKVSYQQDIDALTTLNRSASVEIEIIRPPVVFIHGLGDSQKCWQQLDRSLIKANLYVDSINYRVNYQKTNTESFEVNVPIVGSGIITTQRRAMKQGYVATKCDIVGHSMGGILARLHVQDHNGGDKVNRIITVNTPHSGSEFGDAVMGHKIIFGTIARAFYSLTNFDLKGDINAIRDLAVESEAINHLNYSPNSMVPRLPVHAIATQLDAYSTELNFNKLNLLLTVNEEVAKFFGGPIGVAANVAIKYIQHILIDDLTQIGAGDLIVSTESQLGGCTSTTIIDESIFGPSLFHCLSPYNLNVQSKIKELLVSPFSNNDFTNGWFFPVPRKFDHAGWQLGILGSLVLDYIPALKGAKYGNKFKKVAETLKIDPFKNLDFKVASITGRTLTGFGMVKSAIDIHKKYSGGLETLNIEDTDKYQHYLNIDLLEVDGFSNPLVVVMFDDDNVVYDESYTAECPIPSTFSGDAKIFVYQYNEEDNIVYYEDYLYTIKKPDATPLSIEADETCVSAGEEDSLRLLCKWDDGSETFVDADEVTFEKTGVADYYDGMIIGLQTGHTAATVTYGDLSCNTNVYVFKNDQSKNDSEDSNSICSSITLGFKQKMVMTREAFRGTLTVNNGDASIPMKDFKLNLEVRDKNGKLASTREFQINAESLEGFKGETDLASSWSLGGGQTGIATVLFIPSKFAAPTEPIEYSFGGSFSYTDPYTGLTVTRELNPVTLTVNPSPVLNLTYFLQRDVIGDDPLTETIEPTEEAEFSLLIHNVGYGDATNIRMQTKQPEVIENDKGLVSDFEMVSSELNGEEKTLALGSSVSTEFGDIKPNDTAYAQWWFKNNLLGHFNKYDVSVNHVSSYGNPDLSLLNEVTIHELIRSLEGERKGKKLIGFMTNDIEDTNDTPDMIYLSNGEKEEVYPAIGLVLKKVSENKYILTVNPGHQGWNYGNILDPTYGVSKIMSIVRKSDGKSVSLRNIWQTDRTLRDGKDPLYENRIHFADELLSGATEEYELTFSPAPRLLLEVAAIEGTPMQGTPAGAPIVALNVMMNKHIDPATFTSEDIDMTVQGSRIDSDGIVIMTDDNKTFRLDLSKVDQSEPGYYTITIKTADIVDAEGFAGKNGKTVGWSYYPDGKVSIGIEVYPENSGKVTQSIDGAETSVTPSAVIRIPYGESITLAAVPEEGYEFAEWTIMDESYSSKEKIEFTAISNSDLTAEFAPKSYTVEVDSNCKGGSIYGISTGYYSFGDELSFTAVAEDGFVFKNWIVNGEEAGAELQLTLTVKGETKVSAVFLEGTGVDSLISRKKTVIYSIDGLLINSDATLETIENLEKGVYIINGVKCLIQ